MWVPQPVYFLQYSVSLVFKELEEPFILRVNHPHSLLVAEQKNKQLKYLGCGLCLLAALGVV